MSENNTIYLITGANRGIGLAIATNLLTRPNTTVIATSRQPFAPPSPSTSHPTSVLIPILLDESNPALNSATLPVRLAAAAGINRLDVVIANAGTSSGFKTVLDTDETELVSDFVVNAVGAVKLFRAAWPLLREGSKKKEGEETKKFVLVSSSLGSIGGLGLGDGAMPCAAYGMSKAAANWAVVKMGVELGGEGLLVRVVHPGWVKTAMGQAVADAVHVKEPPLGVDESAKGVITQIDNLTSETSGEFVSYDGSPLPW